MPPVAFIALHRGAALSAHVVFSKAYKASTCDVDASTCDVKYCNF